MKYIFIAGMGRSGTTILCNLLSKSKKSITLGELDTLITSFNDEHLCSCGKCYNSCVEWSNVKNLIKNNKDLQINLCESLRIRNFIFPFLIKRGFEESRIDYFLRDLNAAIEKDAPDIQYFIDSAKNPRWIDLYSNQFDSSYLIYIIRDPRGVINSCMRKESSLVYSIYQWFLYNIASSILFKRFDGKKIMITYESVVNDTESTFLKLRDLFGIDIPDNFEINNYNMHMLTGNQLRSAMGSFLLKEDKSFSKEMSFINRMISSMCVPFYYLFRIIAR